MRATSISWSPVAPSAIPHPVYETTLETIIPEAMTRNRIAQTTAAYAAAAKRAQWAGFDCVEIHAAHGYLISQFHAPFENRRIDQYGGSLENRMRLVLRVADGLRRLMPDDMPLFTRISATDWVDGGWDIEQSIVLARELKDRGVDLIDVIAAGEPNLADLDAAHESKAGGIDRDLGVGKELAELAVNLFADGGGVSELFVEIRPRRAAGDDGEDERTDEPLAPRHAPLCFRAGSRW